jgi:two-component system NtrC family sensor kinase
LIRVQNTELELKVKERTIDLTVANDSLQTTLNNLKETQSQLVEAEKMASLGQLTAGVAHEINNPINFVTSNVAPLRRDVDMIWDTIDTFEKLALNTEIQPDDKAKLIADHKEQVDLDYIKVEVEYLLKGMYEGASRTAEIVKSLRVFSRVDEDTLKYSDINEGIESTMVILNTLVKDKIDVLKIYGDIPPIECHAGKLNQVFLNILSNAIYAIDKKFSSSSGGILKIETGLDDTGDSVFIKITDNGIGISDDIKHKIFEPFFTTKDVGEGTGLGMSIAYKTIENHKGRILVDTNIGEGTIFTVIIPVKQPLK